MSAVSATISSLLQTNPLVLAACIIIPAVYLFLFFDWGASRLPPRLNYLLPALTGQLKLKQTGPNHLIQTGFKKYGDIFRVKLVHRNVIFLVGPQAHRVFMEPNDSMLSASEVYGFTVPVFGRNIVYDAPMKVMQQQMKMLGRGLTGPAMAQHCAKIATETTEFFAHLPNEGTFDMFHEFADLVIMTACRCLLGTAFRKRVTREFGQLYQDLSDGMNHLSFFWPKAPTAKHRARDVARDKIAKLFTEAIEERRSGKFHDDDFLQLLVDAKYQDGTQNTTEQVIGMLLAALFAGQHTSSITSTWTGIEILRNPSLLPRLLEEQAHVMSKYHDDITLDSLAEMELLNACMKEVLRVHPPLVVLLRKVKVDQEYRGFKIPAGEIIAVSPPVAHTLDSVYKEPARFNPDRFLGADAEAQEKFSFIAFGGGRHGCLGERFAFLQVKTIWSTLLRNFEFELLDKNPVPDFENIVSGPKPPCMVKYRRKVFKPAVPPAASSNLI